MSKKPLILGIESSCDETAASLITENEQGMPVVLSNIISSQVDVHKKFGGVVPELAARSHIEKIDWIVQKAIDDSGRKIEEIDAEEKVITTRRISLSSEEKMFVEHIIFSAPIHTTRNEILDQIVDGISSVSGVSREKSTIKYYIYDSVERKKPENRPYRLVFGLKRYSISFKRQAIQEAIKLGQRETQPGASQLEMVEKEAGAGEALGSSPQR